MGLDIPRALDELIQRLLRKDPRDRYQTAEAVLLDLEGIAASLSDGASEPAYVVGLHDRRPTLTEPAFVGRQDGIGASRRADSAGRRRAGGPGLLEAESGGGKTRLLAEVALARRPSGNVGLARAADRNRSASSRFRCSTASSSIVIAAARSDPVLGRRPCTTAWATTPTPSPPRCPNWPGRWAGRPRAAWGRKHSPRREAFRRWPLSSTRWAAGAPGPDHPGRLPVGRRTDGQTDRAIGSRRRRLRPAGGRDVAGGRAFRSEEVAADHLLRKIRPSLHLRLAPFDADEVRQLVGVDGRAAARRGRRRRRAALRRQPVHGVGRAARDGRVGALLAEPTGWRIEPLALADLQSSSRAGRVPVAAHRIVAAGRPSSLLTIGAVLGKEFDLNLAARLLATSRRPRPIAALGRGPRSGTSSGCGRTAPSASSSTTRSARPLLARLTPDRRQRTAPPHCRLPAARTPPAGVFDLAYHFDAAGDSERRCPTPCRRPSRPGPSTPWRSPSSSTASPSAAPARPTSRRSYRIAEGLGDVLMLRGRYDAAGELFETAARWPKATFAEAQIHGKLGELAFKRGDMATRRRRTSRTRCACWASPCPRTAVVLPVPAVSGRSLVQTLHTLLPAPVRPPRATGSPSDAELLRLRLLQPAWPTATGTRAARSWHFWAHLRGMNLARALSADPGAGPGLLRARRGHDAGRLVQPRASPTPRNRWRSAESFGDLWGQGQSLSFYGIVLYAASRFAECIEKCREAVRLLERTGDYWEVHMARYQIAASLYRLGDLRGAVEEARLQSTSPAWNWATSRPPASASTSGRGPPAATCPKSILERELERERDRTPRARPRCCWPRACG